MSKQTFMKQVKELVNCYYDGNDVMNIPIGRIGKKGLNDEIKGFLRKFVEFVLYSNVFCEETKIYIKNVYITYGGIAEEMEVIYGSKPNVNTIQTKVWNDKGKLTRIFGEDFLTELIEYNDITNIERYKKLLDDANSRYGKARELSKIALKLPDTKGMVVKKVSKQDFDEYMRIIAPYSKRHMEFISENISKEVTAYCKYILDNPVKDSDDIDNLSQIMELLED